MTEKELLERFLDSLYADDYLVHHNFSRSSVSNDELDEQIDKFLADCHKITTTDTRKPTEKTG